MKCGETQLRISDAEQEFFQGTIKSLLQPYSNFLEGDNKTIQREKKLLENKRLDLDSCKNKVKKARASTSQKEVIKNFEVHLSHKFCDTGHFGSTKSAWVNIGPKKIKQLCCLSSALITKLISEKLIVSRLMDTRDVWNFISPSHCHYSYLLTTIIHILKKITRSNFIVLRSTFKVCIAALPLLYLSIPIRSNYQRSITMKYFTLIAIQLSPAAFTRSLVFLQALRKRFRHYKQIHDARYVRHSSYPAIVQGRVCDNARSIQVVA